MMMPNCQLVISLTILIIITFNFINVTSLIDPHYVNHKCAKSDNSYTAGSIFDANLNTTLFTTFPTTASLTGFSNSSTGEGSTGDELYSLYYCRGDLEGLECHNCITTAGRKIRESCTLIKEGIIWYQECTLHYATQITIFSTEDTSPSFRNYNFSSILKNLDEHKETFDNLMNKIIMQAISYDRLGKLQSYATGESPVTISSENMILHGLVQCRPDMVDGSCETCLRTALNQMDGWATTMIFLPNCNFRFDLLPSNANSPNSIEKSGRSGPPKVIIAVVVIASTLLLCCFCIFWLRNKRQKHQSSSILVLACNVDMPKAEIGQIIDQKPNEANSQSDVPANIHVPHLDSTDVHQKINFGTSQYYQENQDRGSYNFPEPSAPPLP